MLEGILRALSNLHERLHHSITLYLMPSPTKFVSHSEYLVPNILLLLPMMVTAVRLICFEMEVFDFSTLAVIPFVVASAFVMQVVSNFWGCLTMHVVLFVIYASIPKILRLFRTKLTSQQGRIQSFQVIVCLAGIYVHTPLLLQHVSLALPSSLLCSILISMPRSTSNSKISAMFWGLVLLATWPPMLLVPTVVGRYTTFVNVALTPLHFLLTVMWCESYSLQNYSLR